jgi:RIO kinase 1
MKNCAVPAPELTNLRRRSGDCIGKGRLCLLLRPAAPPTTPRTLSPIPVLLLSGTASQWANAEFSALCQLSSAGLPVPYPVQITGTEVLLEFIGDPDGTGAPRLAETHPDDGELAALWDQLVAALAGLAGLGYAHGDLSPYNLLVHGGRLVMIDLPQVVDVVSHPNGRGFLDRDARNVATWFAARGLPGADPERLARLLAEEARLA